MDDSDDLDRQAAMFDMSTERVIKPLPTWSQAQQTIDDHMRRPIQLLFVLHCVALWEAQSSGKLKWIPGSYHLYDAIRVYLYVIITGDSLRKIYKVLLIPPSTIKRIFNWVWHYTIGFWKPYLKLLPWKDRRRIAKAHFPAAFSEVTLRLDGTAIPCIAHGETNEARSAFHCFKIDGSAFNTIAPQLADGTWTEPSKCLPYATNSDSPLMRAWMDEFKALGLCRFDMTVADKGFIAFRNDNFVVPYKKPRNGSLTQEQVRFNRLINDERGKIERDFGGVQQEFAILKKYRFSHDKIDEVLRLALAVHNIQRFPDRYQLPTNAEVLASEFFTVASSADPTLSNGWDAPDILAQLAAADEGDATFDAERSIQRNRLALMEAIDRGEMEADEI